MKKLAALFLIFSFFLSSSSKAQNTACNAEFNIVYQNANTIQFTPVMTGTPNSLHYWIFGDGAFDNTVSPLHTYLSPGVYTAKHIFIRFGTNGVEECRDSAFRVIQIGSPTSCNLVANFTITPVAGTINAFHFENTSAPLSNTDSIRWTFGDGTSSNDISPNHTYTASGAYNVCLRVQKREPNGTLTNCVSEICHSITVQVPVPCNLLANFTITATSAANTFYFQNTTTGLAATDSIRWTFGDGTSSNTVNPVHTYPNAGTYNVCLRVQKREPNGTLTNCVSDICHTVTVQNPTACTLVANFTATQTATSIYTFHFENTSVPLNNADSVHWTFGDGTSSTEISPNHTYTTAGTYTICLRVQKREPNGTLTNCIREYCHTIIVPVPSTCNLVANFTATQLAGTINTWHFENTSVPLNNTDSIRWTFGDGSSSNAVSPNHTYTAPGTYNVCLRIQKRDPNGGLTNCIREICHTIVVQVTTTCNTPVHFTWTASPQNPRNITFTNQTVSPTASATATWSFGDGTTANTWNAVHEYANAGTYYVCLRVEFSPNCIKYFCDSVRILPPVVSCTAQSNFTFVHGAANAQLIYFTPNTINTTWQYTWTFGDGTGSHDPVTTHTYTQPGVYTACLTVYRNAGCASTTCHTITIGYPVNCDSVHVNYTYQADPSFPNKLFFHAVSNFPINDQTWTITKLPATTTVPPVTIHQNNPYYIFADTGLYRVCLRAVTLNGCIREYCQVIHITQVATTNVCNLQPYPNPGTSSVSVNVYLGLPQMIDVYVFNSMNVLVREKHQQGTTGNNVVTIATGDFVPGIYTMKVIHGNDICYAQFVKL